jgi:PAS domain-containing protein
MPPDGLRWDAVRELLEALPKAVYTTDAAGRLTFYNQAAADFAGRRPELGKDRWCVTSRLYWPDGRPLPHDACPMAVALKENRPVRGVEIIAERPDGTHVLCMPYPTPLHDASGAVIGAVNMIVEIAERRRTGQHPGWGQRAGPVGRESGAAGRELLRGKHASLGDLDRTLQEIDGTAARLEEHLEAAVRLLGSARLIIGRCRSR